MSKADNIQVAVRVRPFSEREKKRGAKCIIQMKKQSTFLFNPEKPKEKPRDFTFDYSFWSHNGFKTEQEGYLSAAADSDYIDQKTVFDTLGEPMLQNAWGGYNCTVFAYGQTGSGKSYSIMGHGANKGLVPNMCFELFSGIGKKTKKGSVHTEVTYSMLEIYNEQVRDLLNKKKSPKGGLAVKEMPEKGFYVENLTVVPVGNYQDIELRMNEGDKQRTLAATKMNETSSRAHTMVKINLKQTDKSVKQTKYAAITLVDLAGSERQKQSEASGDRFEEAKNINKSLMTLGSVIKALCDKALNKSTTVHIPYRDSVLTKLLKNSLGGNSKTRMLAAISPDAENYEQTLSTLRYADRAKSIKTVATINQDDTNKMIQALIGEKEKLLRELDNARQMKATGYTDEDIQKLKQEQEEQIARYRDEMKDAEAAWQKQLEQARKDMEEELKKQKEQEEQRKKVPQIYNLNEDPGLTGKIIHFLKNGQNKIGSGKESTSPDIVMSGLRVHKDHAVLRLSSNQVELEAVLGQTLHNGRELKKDEKVVLKHQDRLRFGSNSLFVFKHPEEEAKLVKKGTRLRIMDYEFAQEEIAQHAGLIMNEEDVVLQREVMNVMQLVQDVNCMAEDMNKEVMLAILLVSPEARGLETGKTEVCVKLQDTKNGNEYIWNKNKFLNRQVHMQEMYQDFVETGAVPNKEKTEDPFWEPADTEVIIGVVSVPLKYLSHMLEFDEEPLTVINYKAQHCGFLKVDLVPCHSDGNEEGEFIVQDPIDLVGKRITFKIKIHHARGLASSFKKSYCRYRFHLEKEFTNTDPGKGANPDYKHERLLHFKKTEVDHKFVDYLSQKSLIIEILGQQEEAKGAAPKALEDRREKLVVLKARNKELEDCLKNVMEVASANSKSKGMKEIVQLIKDVSN